MVVWFQIYHTNPKCSNRHLTKQIKKEIKCRQFLSADEFIWLASSSQNVHVWNEWINLYEISHCAVTCQHLASSRPERNFQQSKKRERPSRPILPSAVRHAVYTSCPPSHSYHYPSLPPIPPLPPYPLKPPSPLLTSSSNRCTLVAQDSYIVKKIYYGSMNEWIHFYRNYSVCKHV